MRTTGAAPSATTAPLPAIDACALLTQQEASTMAGVALSNGRLTSGECYFSGYTPEASVTLQVDKSQDPITALAVFNAAKARLSTGWTVTSVPALEDAAAIARVEGGGTSLGAIVVLDASVVFTVACEQLACSDSELEAGAKMIGAQLGIFKPTA